MKPTIIISVTTFILIILSLFLFPKIKIGHIKLSTYWIIALIGAGITELIIIYFLFRNKLKDTINVEVQEIDHSDMLPPLIEVGASCSMTLTSQA